MKEADEQRILINERLARQAQTEEAKRKAIHAKEVWRTQGIKALNALPIEYRQAWEEDAQQSRSSEIEEARGSGHEEGEIITSQAELQAEFTGAVVRGGTVLKLGYEIELNDNALEYMMGFLNAHPKIIELSILSARPDGVATGLRVGGVDVEAFFSHFKDNTTITTLTLSVKRDLMEDAEAEILAEFLRTDSQLTHFIIPSLIISNSGFEVIIKALEKNVKLEECYFGIGSGPEMLNMLAELEDARSYSIQAAAELLKKRENTGGAEPLLHAFHQHVPIREIHSLIGEYLAVPKLRTR